MFNKKCFILHQFKFIEYWKEIPGYNDLELKDLGIVQSFN